MGPDEWVFRFQRAALFLSGHRDLGDGDRVTLHVARQRHSGVASVHLKQRAVLVGDFVNLTIADEDELTAALDAGQGAVTVGHPRVRARHFCVAGAAHAVADLAGPGLVCREGDRTGDRGQKTEAQKLFHDLASSIQDIQLGPGRLQFTPADPKEIAAA